MKPSMIRLGLPLAAALLLVTTTGAGLAQERVQLDLDGCVQRALAHSRGTAAREDEEDAAGHRRQQAVGRFLPRLAVTARYSRVSHVEPGSLTLPSAPGNSGTSLQLGESVDNQVSTRFSVEQPLFTGLALLGGLRAAEHGRTLAHERVRAERADVRVRAHEAWFGLVKARQLRNVAEQAQVGLEEHLRQLNALHAADRATDLDVSRAEGRVAAARVTLVRAEGAVDNAHLVLTTLLDLPSDTVLELTGAEDDEALEALGPTDDLVSLALTARPEIAIAEETTALAFTRVDLESAPLWPQVFLRFGYNYENPNPRYFPAHDRFDTSWEASAVLSWVVWDWTATAHGVKAARAEAVAAERRLDDVRDAVRIDVEQQRRGYTTSLAQVNAARQSVTSAERAQAAAQRLFEAGKTPSLDVLDATTELARARAELVQSLADARLALANVHRAAGRER